MDTAEAAAQVGVRAGQAVDCGGAEGHKQRPVGGTGWWGGEQTRLRERLEAPSDQHGTAAAVLQLEGLGGLHATYEAPLWRKTTCQFSLSVVRTASSSHSELWVAAYTLGGYWIDLELKIERGHKRSQAFGGNGVLIFGKHSSKNGSNTRLHENSNHCLKCYTIAILNLPDEESFSKSRFDLTMAKSELSTMS